MTHLASISIKDCKIHPQWLAAPNGALLQLRTSPDEGIVVGMKCQIPRPTGIPAPSLLILEGSRAGAWVGPKRDIAALDVSDQFEIHALQPTPRSLTEPEKPGFLYVHEDGAVFMFARSGDLIAHVCVLASKDYQIGIFYPEHGFDLLRVLELGKCALVRPALFAETPP